MARGADRALTFTRPDGTELTAPYLSHPNIRTRAPTRGSPSHDPPVPARRADRAARAARAGQPDRPELDQLARQRLHRLIHQRDTAASA